jgi:crossover junction endodeoxyribonuclease RusA
MDRVTFFVSGRPVAKERPRLGKGGHVYTPRRTRLWESVIGLHGRVARPDGWPMAARYRVTIEIRPFRKKGDLDNYTKSILDGLNGILWDDDAQVDEIQVRRVETPVGVRVTVEVKP